MSTTKLYNAIKLGNLSADPSPALNGMIYYNTTSNRFRKYENDTWSNDVSAVDLNNYYTKSEIDAKINKISQEIDFGVSGDFVSATVSAPWVLTTTIINLSITPNLTDHDEEDSLLEELKVSYGNIVENTSFDIFVHAPQESWGRFIIKGLAI